MPQGEYSLYFGWYICAAILTPLFDLLNDWKQSFWDTFSHQNNLFWAPIVPELHRFGPKFHFRLNIFFSGPIFSGPWHPPTGFRTEYPPPPGKHAHLKTTAQAREHNDQACCIESESSTNSFQLDVKLLIFIVPMILDVTYFSHVRTVINDTVCIHFIRVQHLFIKRIYKLATNKYEEFIQ